MSQLDWPQRSETIRWRIYDRDGNLLGDLMVSTGQTPTITNDATRSIRRSVSNIEIPARPLYDVDLHHVYADDINTLTTRVRPFWTTGDGTEYPLGVFIWGDDSTVQWSAGSPKRGTLTDLCSILDQPIDGAVGFGSNIGVRDAILQVLDGLGISSEGVSPTDARFGVAVGWAAGRDTYLTVLDGLCKNAGFLPPYFDNVGVLQCRPSPDLSAATAEFTYGFGTTVVPGTAVFSNDALTAPNRYVIVGGSTDAELVGIFDIPAAAPNSYENIGRRVRKTDTVQGLETQAAVDQAAAAAYATDMSSYTWLSFDSRVDPRHDTWNIIEYDFVNYREVGWTIECRPGGKMSHSLRGTYT